MTTRGGEGKREVTGRGVYDMYLCANLYTSHNRSMMLRRLLPSVGSGTGRWSFGGLGLVGGGNLFRCLKLNGDESTFFG